MIEIAEIASCIPDGKKVGYLGRIYVKALTDYHHQYTDSSVDLNTLFIRSFKEIILEDDVISDIRLFSPEKLSAICDTDDSGLQDLTIGKIRHRIISYYGYTYDEDVFEPFAISTETECSAALHDFQERIRRKVINLLYEDQKRFLIHMPTGAGKTRTAGEIIVDFIRLSASRALFRENIKILWIAQSKELCVQAYETIKWLLENKTTEPIKLAHYYGSEDFTEDISNSPAVIFCSIQKLLNNYKKPIWNEIKEDNYLIVVDEAHRSVASKWVTALDYFAGNTSVYLLGLTATPGGSRSDSDNNNLLSTYYHNNKIGITDADYTEIEKPIQYLVGREFLADIERIDIDSNLEVTDTLADPTDGEFNFTSNTLAELSSSSSRNSSIVNAIKENYEEGKKILVFTCGTDHNRILQTLLAHHEIPSAHVDANSKDRAKLINDFKEGDLNVLLNYGVLTTGFDAPLTDVCIIARPISSIVMYSQMVGRILRGPKNSGNKVNKLYTIRDNLNHGDYDTLFNSFNDFYQ